jgi:glycosyltransferase involved in cell wall biosynthesis
MTHRAHCREVCVLKPLRIVLLGSLPPPAGGTTLLFEQLVTLLRPRGELSLSVIDTGPRGALARARALARLAVALPGADVIALHASPPGIARIGPSLLRAGRPLIVRVFGGSLDLALTTGEERTRARLARVVEGAARVLVETDQVAAWLRANRSAVRASIQRNSRVVPKAPPAPPPGSKRFAFVGTVSEEKGALELAAAMRICAIEGVTLDVFGACANAAVRAALERAPGVRIRGELPNHRVGDALAVADALVLPTHHEAEGHPGAILEAFAAARAVIATRHRAIPEIVEHERNGLLIPLGDARALADAMLRIASDRELAARLGAAGFERAREFDAAIWAERFVAACREVVSC